MGLQCSLFRRVLRSCSGPISPRSLEAAGERRSLARTPRYRTDWRKRLKEATPEYIDVFFDNTGGDILDACLARAARDARFVICGAISQYNAARPQGPANFLSIISQRITMKGFIVFDYIKNYPAARKELASWLAEGKLKRKEHIVLGGLEAARQALVDLYAGANTGKMMVQVAPVSEALTKAKL
ncbi:hypothetical protein N7467_011388 [Penicillium canescens]|nr:hypothetical protein N7467_011388 [Penicillium canescens]